MKATKQSHDWHCHNHDTYGWRGEECKQCPVAPSKVEQLQAENAALKERVAQLEGDRDTYKQGMAKVIIERDALQSKSAALVDALNLIMRMRALTLPPDVCQMANAALDAFKGEK